MSYQTLTLETDNHVATITLNRPEMMNAFSEQLIWDMGEATKAVKDDLKFVFLLLLVRVEDLLLELILVREMHPGLIRKMLWREDTIPL